MFLDNLRARIYNEVKAHTTGPTRGGYPVNRAVCPSVLRGFSFSAQTGRLFIRTHKQHAEFAPASTGCALVLPPPHPDTRAGLRLRFGPRSGASARPCNAPSHLARGQTYGGTRWHFERARGRIVLRLSGARQDASNVPYRSGTRVRGQAPPCGIRTREQKSGSAMRGSDAQA